MALSWFCRHRAKQEFDRLCPVLSHPLRAKRPFTFQADKPSTDGMGEGKSFWCVAALAVALVAVSSAAEKKEKEQKQLAKPQKVQPQKPQPQKPQVHQAAPVKPTLPQKKEEARSEKNKISEPVKAPQAKKNSKADKDVAVHARQPATTVTPQQTQLLRPTPPPCKLTEVKKPGGTVERLSPSNKVRERTVVEQKTGNQKTQQLGVTGRVEVEEVKRKDGTRQLTQYDLGREKKIQVVRKDGSVETTDIQYN